MEYFYKIEIKRKSEYYNSTKKLDTLEEVKQFVTNLKEDQQIIEIKKFYVIYKHIENMPKYDYIDSFNGWNVYNEKYKLNKCDLKTIKVIEYKNNLINDNDNYMINYNIITEHNNLSEILIKCTCCFEAKALKQIKEHLYYLSKSNQVFDIVFYQYEVLDINNL